MSHFVKPPYKWAGGKTQLLPHLLPLVPKKFGTYFEPFFGGGALFFALSPLKAVISDVNAELCATLRAIRDQPDALIAKLKKHEKAYRDVDGGDRYYYTVRSAVPSGDKVDTGARFIFLNKTNFNGLYRVNRRGVFNVPHGKFKNPPKICDVDTLRACAKVLVHARIGQMPFDHVLGCYAKGDFIYFDPPYVPLSATSDFTAYSRSGFGPDAQKYLRDVALLAKKKGVAVLLSNSSSPLVRELYGNKKDFEIFEVDVRRGINSDASKRGAVKELIIKTKGW